MSGDQKPTQEICQAIEDIRRAYPDLRFGQTLVNALSAMPKSDLFYITDEELIHALQDYLALSGIFTASV